MFSFCPLYLFNSFSKALDKIYCSLNVNSATKQVRLVVVLIDSFLFDDF